MSPSRAVLVAAIASLGLHLVALFGMSGIALLRIAPPIPIEILPMKKRPAAPPAVDPPKQKPEGQKPAKPSPSKPISESNNAKPSKPQPPAVEDLRPIGPANANITVVLRGPLLAKSPHREGVDQLLQLLPDYHTLLDGTGLNPFDDLEALLIATPDPRDVASTFLAARHHGDPRLLHLVGRPLGAGDPRQFRTLGNDLMLLGRPEDLQRIAAAEQGATTVATGELAEAARWLAALRHFDAGKKDAAMLLSISDLSLLIRLRSTLPLPRSIRLAMSAEAAPAVRLLCTFDEETIAHTFFAMWPELKQRIADAAPIFSGALDDLTITQKDREVEVVGHLKEGHVRLALSFVRLTAPHRPAPPSEPSAPDL